MRLDGPQEVGLLVVRVWVEPGSPTGIRARVATTLRLGGVDETSVVRDSTDEILEVVARFLEGFAAGIPGPP